MSIERTDAALGMTVLLSDGTKLGRAVRASGERLEVEQGLVFRKRYWIRFSDVDRESAGKLHLRLSRDGLSVNEPSPQGRPATIAPERRVEPGGHRFRTAPAHAHPAG